MTNKEAIYEIVLGQMGNGENTAVSGMEIENLFSAGGMCDRLYEEVYRQKNSICSLLHVSESEQLETIVGNMFEISRILAMKMYDYGFAAAQKVTH